MCEQFEYALAQPVHAAVPDMEHMCSMRFKYHRAHGSDKAPAIILKTLPLAEQPAVKRSQHLLCGVFHTPGLRCGEIVGQEIGDTGMACLPACLSSADTVCDHRYCTFRGKQIAVGNSNADRVFVVLLATGDTVLPDPQPQAIL